MKMWLFLVDAIQMSTHNIHFYEDILKMISELSQLVLPSMAPYVIVVVLLFYVHSKHLRSCRDGQLT